VTRKLNSSWIDVYFKDYDGETETKAETTAVMPYWHRHESEDTEKALQVDHVKAKADATAEGLAFGSSETAPWYVLASRQWLTTQVAICHSLRYKKGGLAQA
jgi:hypothetical protein